MVCVVFEVVKDGVEVEVVVGLQCLVGSDSQDIRHSNLLVVGMLGVEISLVSDTIRSSSMMETFSGLVWRFVLAVSGVEGEHVDDDLLQVSVLFGSRV